MPGCHNGGVSNFPSHTSSLWGFAPFLLTEPAFNIWADWRISWPVPRPGSGPSHDQKPAPAHTEREREREEGRHAGRMEKGKRRGEYEAERVRGMEQIKNRCLYTCDSAFQNGAKCLWSLRIFRVTAPRWTYTVRLYPPRWRQTMKSLLLSITSSHFLTRWVINMQRGPMLTHLETTQPLSPLREIAAPVIWKSVSHNSLFSPFFFFFFRPVKHRFNYV